MRMILKFLAVLALALEPIQNELIALFIVMGADAFTGVWKAVKLKEFSSRKLAHTVAKFTLYFLAVIIAQLADVFFGLPKIQNLLAGGIVLIEITSIFENINVITGTNIFEKIFASLKRHKENESR